MASVFEIIGKAENRAMEFELPFPSEEPKMFITVRRMPEVFVNNARFLADGNLRSRSLTPKDSVFQNLFYLRICYEIVEFMKTHATAWKAADGGKLKEEFGAPMFAKWVDDLDQNQRQDLGDAYFTAIAEDQKKLTPGASGPPDSSTPSENESSTT